MKIKNIKAISTNKEREVALAIAEAGYDAIDTRRAIERGFKFEKDVLFIQGKFISLKHVDRIFVVGAGKCSVDAGEAMEKILGDRLTDGIIVGICEGGLKKIKTFCGTHPFPTQINVEATSAIIKMLEGLTERDLVIFLISGGGSTLLCQPQKMTCEDESTILKKLFEKGATIEEINVLRKHLSSARGGFLAQYAYPAKVVSYIFSDVPGDDIRFVASGPTVKDTTTVKDAKKILDTFNIEKEIGFEVPLFETPKEDKYFEHVWNTLIVSNTVALQAMADKARELGFVPVIKTSTLAGEARELGVAIVNELHTVESKTVLLYGGEPTVTIHKPGKGGRGLELVLSGVNEIQVGELLMSLASDGRDNTDFAGALCDIMTKEKARQMDLDPIHHIEENASYAFFEKVGDYISTGNTGSNVSDLIVAIKI